MAFTWEKVKLRKFFDMRKFFSYRSLTSNSNLGWHQGKLKKLPHIYSLGTSPCAAAVLRVNTPGKEQRARGRQSWRTAYVFLEYFIHFQQTCHFLHWFITISKLWIKFSLHIQMIYALHIFFLFAFSEVTQQKLVPNQKYQLTREKAFSALPFSLA